MADEIQPFRPGKFSKGGRNVGPPGPRPERPPRPGGVPWWGTPGIHRPEPPRPPRP